MREAVRLAKDLGADVEIASGTGEYLIRHRAMGIVQRVNSRRKDTPRSLVVWLRKLSESAAMVPA
jgi:hypothetical protein